MSEVKITSHKKDVLVKLEKATDEMLEKLAIQGVGLTRVNIRENGQIDTGFMVNSVFHIAPGGRSTYSEAEAEAKSKTWSEKRGVSVDHSDDMAPEPRLPDPHMAAICVGANYAIYQETQNAFLYPAAEELAKLAGGVIQEVARGLNE